MLREQPAEALRALDPALILPIQVEEQLVAFVTLGPGHEASADLQLGMAVLRLRQGKLAGAEKHARRAIELAVSDHRAHRVLERVLRRQGRNAEAGLQRKMADALDPDLAGR